MSQTLLQIGLLEKLGAKRNSDKSKVDSTQLRYVLLCYVLKNIETFHNCGRCLVLKMGKLCSLGLGFDSCHKYLDSDS